MTDAPATSQPPGQRIECAVSASFAEWMSQAGGTLAVTTYQAGKVALIGWDGKQVTLLMRDFDKPLGLAAHGGRMALATRHEVLLFANAPLLAHDYLEDQPGRYDALYLPRASYYTGDLNVHDLAFGEEGLWVVNTRFCCLSALSKDYSFVPRWKPPFLTAIVPEDRCHLNGLAMQQGKPRFVTALGTTDVVGGWREKKATGGVVLDVASGEVVMGGLSMPHSPRMYDGALWVLNSGTGELLCIDPEKGTHGVVCSLPGYLRGLCFLGPFALVGLCQIRERHIFGGLPIQDKYPKLQCGIAIIDLRTGQQVAMFEFTSGCQELYEISFLPGIRQGMIVNQHMQAAKEAFTAPEFSYWLRPSNVIQDDPISGAPEGTA